MVSPSATSVSLVTGIPGAEMPGSNVGRVPVPADAAVATDAAPMQTDLANPGAGVMLRPGTMRNWDLPLNTMLAGGQQAQAFLGQLASQLKSLKADISAQLASGQPADPGLQNKLSQLAALWRTRQAASGASLDGQLRYTSPPQATQRFTVRGLSIANLQTGDKEVLSLSFTGASGQQRVAVDIRPGLSAQDIVQRFNQALAPANIQVSGDSSGNLVFSAAESDGAAIMNSLSIRGDGVRFPTGALVRVRVDAVPDVLQPANWSVQDTEAMRRTLRELQRASDAVARSQASVTQDLTTSAARLAAAKPTQDASWAAAAAQTFQSSATQPAYPMVTALAAAVSGVRRDAVQALLSLPVTASGD